MRRGRPILPLRMRVVVVAAWVISLPSVEGCRKSEQPTATATSPAPTLKARSDAGGPRELDVKVGTVGTLEQITKGIRRQLRETRTSCDEGPPSAESQAEWRRLSKPRELANLSTRELVKRGDVDVVNEIASRLLDEKYATGLRGMTRAEQNVYFVNELVGEVMGGGYHGYFANSSGNCAARTRTALDEIAGLDRWAALHDRAMAKFPGGRPSEDRATRGDQMEAMDNEWEAWGDVEDELYKLRGIDAVLGRYIRRFASAFTPPR